MNLYDYDLADYKYDYRFKSASELARTEVVRVLMEQPGNHGKTAEYLSDKWVASDHFLLTTVHVHLPDLGVTAGKTGDSQTSGPIIVDENIQHVARAEGSFGAAPDFLVLDGQNRVVAARKKGPRTTIQAFVGDKIISDLRRKDAAYGDNYKDLQALIGQFLDTPSMPGGLLTRLRDYIRVGVLTQEELDDLRKQWRAKYK